MRGRGPGSLDSQEGRSSSVPRGAFVFLQRGGRGGRGSRAGRPGAAPGPGEGGPAAAPWVAGGASRRRGARRPRVTRPKSPRRRPRFRPPPPLPFPGALGCEPGPPPWGAPLGPSLRAPGRPSSFKCGHGTSSIGFPHPPELELAKADSRASTGLWTPRAVFMGPAGDPRLWSRDTAPSSSEGGLTLPP